MISDITQIIDELDMVRARLNMKLAEENEGQSERQYENWRQAYETMLEALDLLRSENR